MEIECDEWIKRVFMCATEPKWRQNVSISSSVLSHIRNINHQTKKFKSIVFEQMRITKRTNMTEGKTWLDSCLIGKI